jgi:hypothetical protein
MDLTKVIQDLHAQKANVDRAIAAVEELQRAATNLSVSGGSTRRGRKSMGARERKEVSDRMKKYWADHRR